MAVAGSFSLVLGIWLLFHSAYARPEGTLCTERTYGSPSVYAFPLGIAYLQDANVYTYDVSIPEVCSGGSVGVRLTVCDYNEEPDVLIISNYQAYTTRNDGLFYPASVTGVVYCSDYVPLASGENAPKVSVKGISASRKGYQAYNQDAVRADILQATLDRHPAQTAQTINARQATDLVREALAANLRQVSSDPARHNLLDARLSDQSSDASRINLRLNYKRLRRASRSSETDKPDSIRDVQVDKARQAVVDQVKNQDVHHAEQTSEALIKNQLPTVQKRTRRALRLKIEVPETRQDVDAFHRALANDNVRKTSSDQARKQADLDERRHSQNPKITDARQITEAVREAALDQALRQFITETHLPEQVSDTSRINLHHKVYKRLRRSLQTSDIRQSAASADTRRAAEIIRKILDANMHQSSSDKAQTQAIQDANRAVQAVQASTTNNEHQTNFEQAQQQAFQNSRAVLAAQVSNNRQEAEQARQTLQANNARQTSLDQIQQQAIQEVNRAFQAAQASNARQTAENVRQSSSALTSSNTRQTNVDQAQQQAIQEVYRAMQSAQESNTRQIANSGRQIIKGNDAQQIDLYQAQQQAIKEANRAAQSAQASEARQIIDKVRQAIAANNIRSTGLDQARQTISRTAQVNEARQTEDVVRDATAANTQQVALDQGRKLSSDVRQTNKEVGTTSSVNIHQATADQVRRLSEQSLGNNRSDLPVAARRFRRSSQSPETLKVVDAVRDSKEDKSRQAELDKAIQKVSQEIRNDQVDSQSKNPHSVDQKRLRRALLATDNLLADIKQQNAYSVDLDRSLNDVHLQAIRDATQTRQVQDARRVADALRDAAVGAYQAPGAHTRVNNAHLQALQEGGLTDPTAQSIGARQVSDLLQEAFAANARQAALEQAHKLLEAGLGYVQH